MSYRLRGWGDILVPDSSAGTALSCGLFAGGMFKRECWCLDWPQFCSRDEVIAAQQMAHPEFIAAPPMPPPVRAPIWAFTDPTGGGQTAQVAVNTVLDDQMRAWQEINAATVAETAATADALGRQYDQQTSWLGVPWYWWALGGVGLVAVVSVKGGRR